MEDSSREIAQNTGFWKDTLERQLLGLEQLEKCLSDIPLEKRTPEKIENRLARLAVHHKYLTLWQAQRILTRRATSLMLDKYLLLDTLGQGGMGRVFLALDRRLNRRVAIKVLNPDRMNHERSLARFEREAQVGGQLQHENLVRIYDVGLFNHSPYLVMEYIEGPTVSFLIEKNGRLDLSQTARIGRDVALGLQHLAEKRMVHRDVNPRNILIDQEGRAKLTDLGLAIFEEQQAQVTTEGSTVGTFDYISPEQARHSHGVDIRSDLYSLGCSLYHMISGQVPFPAGSLPEKIYAHQVKDSKPLQELVPDIPREMVRIINRCLKKKPEERFATAKELADRLSPFITSDSQFKTVDLLKTGSAELPSASQIEMIDSRIHRPGIIGNEADGGREISWDGANPSGNAPPIGQVSDPDAIRIDLGNDSLELPYRSDTNRSTTERSFSKEYPVTGKKSLLIIAVVFLLTVLLFNRIPIQGPKESKNPSSKNSGLVSEDSGEPLQNTTSGVVVRFADNTEQECTDLTDAIRRSSGKQAVILLNASEKPWVWKVSDQSPVVGDLTIRSRHEDVVRILIELSNSKSGVRIRSGARLQLIGLVLEPNLNSATKPLFESLGQLQMENCWVLHRNAQMPASTAIYSNSDSLILKKTWIYGFQTALHIPLLPETKIMLENCLLTAPSTGVIAKKTNQKPAERAPLIILDQGKSKANRTSLVLTQSSLIGPALLRFLNPNPQNPTSIEANHCLFQNDRLIEYVNPTAANGTLLPVRWNGTNNLFDVKDAFLWESPDKMKIRNFSEWSKFALEKNSLEQAVPLVNPFAQVPQPSDFLPKSQADRQFGYR